ncbi:putative small heat shock protein HSP20 [Rosa chinensis]|uniref:Putative small heat shock protein HSP20 n=1 Tax=Rosa chinensis TaxID=74649 RepID=A0A2P6QBP0_ROSCH|nr:21.7 kDa class VI heat shock protein isoform X1 [Rosa chinensis]PRQ31591.1 putative small heat shock protein HSP20 [Rosa chinensis]
MTTTTHKQLEVLTDDQTPQKWCVLLREEVFKKFMSQGSPIVHKVFGVGSFFSPLLFGKFFDPSDAFPLWDFESDILLSSLRSSGQSTIDWFQTEQYYVLKAELPGEGKNSVQVYAENAKVLEISGQWKQQQQQKDQSKTNSTRDWRSGNWWESGYVRRLELPQDADWRKIEAYVTNDLILEIKIHKINNSLDADNNQNTTA